jgi:hypothetical protein
MLRPWQLSTILMMGTFMDRRKCTRRELRTGAFYAWPMLYGWVYPQLMMVSEGVECVFVFLSLVSFPHLSSFLSSSPSLPSHISSHSTHMSLSHPFSPSFPPLISLTLNFLHPPPSPYHPQVTMIMMTYSCIAPLLMPFCVLFFVFAYLLYKYQV